MLSFCALRECDVQRKRILSSGIRYRGNWKRFTDISEEHPDLIFSFEEEARQAVHSFEILVNFCLTTRHNIQNTEHFIVTAVRFSNPLCLYSKS
jgi:hypothetical protein